jgi:hypothetical protein
MWACVCVCVCVCVCADRVCQWLPSWPHDAPTSHDGAPPKPAARRTLLWISSRSMPAMVVVVREGKEGERVRVVCGVRCRVQGRRVQCLWLADYASAKV